MSGKKTEWYGANHERLNSLSNKLRGELSVINGDLLNAFPVDIYIQFFSLYPEIGPYNYLIPELEQYCKNFIESSDEKALELYHQLVLITLIQEAKHKLSGRKLPEDVKLLYVQNFERIVNSIEFKANPPGFYLYPQDKFYKDLSVCNMRMIPAGARKIHLARLPKGFLYAHGWRQFVKGMAFVLFELKGLEPLYQAHFDSHDQDLIAEFSPEGHRRYFRRVAGILKMNKTAKGLFGSGWLLDPQLKKISPSLAHLREMITQGGGRLFYLGPDPKIIKDALALSPVRRTLYNEGKYIPTKYLMVWSRRKLIKWAGSQLDE